MDLDDFVRRADEVIALGERVWRTQGQSEWGGTFVDAQLFGEFRASGLSLLRNVFGDKHPCYVDFNRRVENNNGSVVQFGLGILRAARTELAGGWVATTTGIVSGEIFADFIEMARYLLSEKYKDAAAVIAGSVLEEHLRQLCIKHGVSTSTPAGAPKKADAMNSDLAAAGAYNKLDQKNVTAWLDLRNKAAHGRYAEYNQQQVEQMLQATSEFMARNAL